MYKRQTLDHGIPVHPLCGLRGQLNADLAGLVADVDNHIVIRGSAGLIQESGGQFDPILLDVYKRQALM